MLEEGTQDGALGNTLNEKLRNMKCIPSFFNLCVFDKFASFFFQPVSFCLSKFLYNLQVH